MPPGRGEGAVFSEGRAMPIDSRALCCPTNMGLCGAVFYCRSAETLIPEGRSCGVPVRRVGPRCGTATLSAVASRRKLGPSVRRVGRLAGGGIVVERDVADRAEVDIIEANRGILVRPAILMFQTQPRSARLNLT